MTPEFFVEHAIVPAMRLLPATMDSREARAMLVAIALQESRIIYRRQIGGPARGYFQFEQGGGVRGVLTHLASKQHARAVLMALDYAPDAGADECYAAIEHNDILASAFARLLLWTCKEHMPAQSSSGQAWSLYLAAWRPGKPRRESWDAFFEQAWDVV